MINRKIKKFLSGILITTLLFSSVNVSSFADGVNDAIAAITETISSSDENTATRSDTTVSGNEEISTTSATSSNATSSNAFKNVEVSSENTPYWYEKMDNIYFFTGRDGEYYERAYGYFDEDTEYTEFYIMEGGVVTREMAEPLEEEMTIAPYVFVSATSSDADMEGMEEGVDYIIEELENIDGTKFKVYVLDVGTEYEQTMFYGHARNEDPQREDDWYQVVNGVVYYDGEPENIIELANVESSVSYYATKDELMNNFDPDRGNIGKIVFGTGLDTSGNAKEQQWYILGKDDGVSGDNTAIFADSNMLSYVDGGDNSKLIFQPNYSSDTKYTGSDMGTYTSGSPVNNKVSPNHYGASNIRTTLQSMEEDTDYFNTTEQSLLNATTVQTDDFKNSTDTSTSVIYTTTDKLYLGAWDYDGLKDNSPYATGADRTKFYIGSETSKKVLPVSTYWARKDGESHPYFWLRSPSSSNYSGSLNAYPGSGVNNYFVNSIYCGVRPASNINLSFVLFASSAESKVAGKTVIADGTAMRLRLDGSKLDLGNVKYTSDTITVEKGTYETNPTYLCVQSADDDGSNWYYGMEITEPITTVYKNTIDTDIDLTKCHIWLETAADDGMIYANNNSVKTEKGEITITCNINGATKTNDKWYVDDVCLDDAYGTPTFIAKAVNNTTGVAYEGYGVAGDKITLAVDTGYEYTVSMIDVSRYCYESASWNYNESSTSTTTTTESGITSVLPSASSVIVVFKNDFPISLENHTSMDVGVSYKVSQFDFFSHTSLDSDTSSSDINPQSYVVEFKVNGNGVEKQEVAKGDAATKIEDPVVDGYKFTGWYTDEKCTTAYDFRTPVTKDIILYAGLKAVHTVYFNNGSSVIGTQTVLDGECAVVPTEPTQTGYIFKGWYTADRSNAEYATEYDFNTPVTEDLKLYAWWKADGESTLLDASDLKTALNSLVEASSLTAFIESDTAPSSSVTTKTISTSDSRYPIYAWADGTTIKWYSEANVVKTNTSLNNVFSSGSRWVPSAITDISGIKNWDTSNLTSADCLFGYCSKLTDISPLANWNTKSLTNCYNMFVFCDSIIDISALSSWDTGSVANMSCMFYYCSSLTNISALSNWDTGSVTNMSSMFYSCKGLTDISALSTWNTSSVTNMSLLFTTCHKITDLSTLKSWNTSNVINMGGMFSYCINLTTLSGLNNWDMSSVTNMYTMFQGCTGLTDASEINDWDITKVTNFTNMFQNCSVHPTFSKRTGTWSNGTFTPTS